MILASLAAFFSSRMRSASSSALCLASAASFSCLARSSSRLWTSASRSSASRCRRSSDSAFSLAIRSLYSATWRAFSSLAWRNLSASSASCCFFLSCFNLSASCLPIILASLAVFSSRRTRAASSNASCLERLLLF